MKLGILLGPCCPGSSTPEVRGWWEYMSRGISGGGTWHNVRTFAKLLVMYGFLVGVLYLNNDRFGLDRSCGQSRTERRRSEY